MLIFDELKKNDPQLRLVAMVLVAGLGILLAGLWWVQVVSAREYQSIWRRKRIAPCAFPPCAEKFSTAKAACSRKISPRYNLMPLPR